MSSSPQKGLDEKESTFAPQMTDEDWMFPYQLDYLEDESGTFLVKMSSNNNCLIFVNKTETFVVDFKRDGTTTKRKIPHMSDKVVHFIQEDPYENGFYIICSK